jgi:hypothetical protein
MAERFRDERLSKIYEYWRSKRQGRPAPARSDIVFAEIAHLLPVIQIIEVQQEPMRFRHRFVGTEIVESMGRDVTGRYVDQTLYGTATDEIVASLETVVREARPYRREALLTWYDRDWLVIETVELPLLDDSGEIGAIRGGVDFRRRDADVAERLVHRPLPKQGDEAGNGNGAPPAPA